MSVLGVIPARGGSKGIPRKNVRLLAGKPLIAWTIIAARESACLDRLIVTTDDPDIADVARDWGAEVPFMRPANLAADDTPGVDPVLHAIELLPNHDWVLLLQPTSPLRRSLDIDGIVSACRASSAPAAVSVTKVVDHSSWTFPAQANGRLSVESPAHGAGRRQELPVRFALNGSLYLARTEWLGTTQSFFTSETIMYETSPESSIDIDTELDWQLAEHLMGCSPA